MCQTTDSLFFQSCQQNPPNSFCYNPSNGFDVKTCLSAQTSTQIATINIPTDTMNDWEIKTEFYLGINPSSSNYLDINLIFSTDSIPINYKIRIGDKLDNLAVYNTKNEILGSTTSLFNRSSSQFAIRLQFKSSRLNIFWQWKDSILWNLISNSTLPNQSELTNLTINLIQTGSSSVGKWSFQIPKQKPIITDTTGPSISNFIWKSSTSAWMEFNEALRIDSTYCHIWDSSSNCNIRKINHFTLEIIAPKPWPCNDSFEIKIFNIADTCNNIVKLHLTKTIHPCILPIKRGQLMVTEIMHHPAEHGQQSAGVPPFKYLELQNTHTQGLWLTNAQICDAVSCAKLPNYWLKAKQFLVLYSAKDSIFATPDFKKTSWPIANFPTYNSAEDSIIIKNQQSEIIYQNRYREEYHEEPFKSGGFSLERAFHSPDQTNWLNWQSNNSTGGTPGYMDSCIRIPKLPQNLFSSAVINQNNEIEIQCIQPLLHQQWETLKLFVLDSQHKKANIDASLLVSNNEHARFLLNNPTNTNNYSNRQLIISAMLFSEKSTFEDTLDLYNESDIKKPSSQDLIISEIQFNASTNGLDYVEIYNKSNFPIDLSSVAIRYYYDDSIPRWQIPMNHSNRILLPKHCLILCKDAEILQKFYPDLPMTRVMENSLFLGLNADFGLLELMDMQTFVRLDLAGYNDKWHHPEFNQTQNTSLERVGVASIATNPWNWRSHGRNKIQNKITNPCFKDSFPQRDEMYNFCSPGFHKEWSVLDFSSTFNLNQWKFQQSNNHNYLCIEYQLPMPDCLIQVKMLTISGQLISTPIHKERIDFSGNLCFPASTTSKLPKGAYLISVRCLLPDGNTIQKQLPFTIL